METTMAVPHGIRPSDLIVNLMRQALAAPDVPSAVVPILESFVSRTAADGAAHFQMHGELFHARAAAGVLPDGPAMDALLAHGLSSDTPLMRALEESDVPLFFDNTNLEPAATGFAELGVASLAASPVREVHGELLGAFLMHSFAAHQWTEPEQTLVSVVAGAMSGLAARLIAEEATQTAREGAIRALGLALEYRDRDTKGHTDRVTALTLALGMRLHVDPASLQALRWAAYLHDVGKLAVPDAILLKPGPLTESEWGAMRTHAQLGHDFASELEFLPAETLDIILHHHERWDGTGYPEGLAAEEIPLLARIFAISDAYDALRHERPYKPAWPRDEAIGEIKAQTGRQFDPAVVRAFIDMDPDF